MDASESPAQAHALVESRVAAMNDDIKARCLRTFSVSRLYSANRMHHRSLAATQEVATDAQVRND